MNPKTNENYVIVTKYFRISFLSERLFRIETKSYLDEATQIIINRQVNKDFEIDFKELEDAYEFITSAIKVIVGKKGEVRVIALNDTFKVIKNFKKSNLKGTARTLDGVNGSCKLSDGIISLDGVAILDDSNSLIVYENKLYKREKATDLYYFAYGHRYQDALDAFYNLTGKVPLIPRYALGNWWSRYHAYTDEEYIELIESFKTNNIPINVSVIDMDWHYVDVYSKFKNDSLFTKEELEDQTLQAIYYDGWTGYTWNKDLFKDYKSFLSYLHDNNLKVTLNLHPARGVRKYEAMFDEFAKSLNIDPNSVNTINFDVADDKFMDSYFKVLHHPYEKDGVDFWWIDWQQGVSSSMEFLDPLWALNHYHYLDNDRETHRPLILSRYSGPGSHRYPLGFSGDTYITWESLRFQPYFTATSTNIGYVWWSHDIGGHMCGVKDDELYIRWLQLGVFSPINRLHSTCNLYTGKEPWKFNKTIERIATNYLRLRKGIIPYLYSMNYQTYKNNIALVRPMYYIDDSKLAYKYKNQFAFGSELIVAPITNKTNKVTSLAKVDAYLPEGTYFDIFTDEIYNGNMEISFYRDLHSIPVLARQGSIIPLYVDKQSNNISNNQDLEILVYSGNNLFALYEDDGESKDYLDGKYSLRNLIVNKENDKVSFKVSKNNNPLYQEELNRYLYIKFKDIVNADVYCNTNYEIIKDKCLVIKVLDTNINIDINLDNIAYLTNVDKKKRIINLVSSYQMKNDDKNDLFLHYYDEKYPKKCLPKSLYGPIEEILKQK